MSFFDAPPKPETPLGWHRVLSPTAAIKVSPISFGGISLGNSWSALFGKTEDHFGLLDTFFSLGGNFIDTANNYNSEESEQILGEWMEERGNRDQMVIATKFGSGFRAYNRENEPMQTNFTGASAKSMHISVRESLKKLRTDYIDILYLHWWDFSASVEEVMTHLHKLVLAKQVLYLGVSDAPAWIVVKANEFARRNGLTPFSVYQGRWNAAYRDMEAEIIPMCEDQGMGIVSWGSLGGGQLATADHRRKIQEDPDVGGKYYIPDTEDIKVCNVLERIASEKKVTLQSVALAYLFHQSTHVIPIVGVQSAEHVKALPEALKIKLTPQDVADIQDAKSFNPLFPNTFLYHDSVRYNTRLTPADQLHFQMACWIDAPPKQAPYEPRK